MVIFIALMIIPKKITILFNTIVRNDDEKNTINWF